MRFPELLQIVGDEPVFSTGLLLAGEVDESDVRRQLSRWKKTGRLYQLRRGLYALAPPFQKIEPHPFEVANELVAGSYVSCESALAYFSLIPELTPVVTSVTTARPSRKKTPLGVYQFHHLKPGLFFGFSQLELGGDRNAFVARPEKALLDLVYLRPGGDTMDYLRELRLQNLDALNLDRLRRYAEASRSPKLRRAAERAAILHRAEDLEYEPL